MLDQGQTITIDAIAQVYNLTVFDGLHTERVTKLASTGQQSKLRIDHTEAKTPGNNNRHLAQYQEDIVESVSGEIKPITVNITINAPTFADDARIEAIVDGFSTWYKANLSRMLGLES